MICGSLSVFLLSLLTLGVLSETIERNVVCGEDIKIPSDCNGTKLCDPNREIEQMELKRNNKTLLEIPNVTFVDPKCSENEKFCLTVAKDRKRANLTMRGVTFPDQGRYNLYLRRSDGEAQIIIINVFVHGVCEPIVKKQSVLPFREGSQQPNEDTTKANTVNIVIPILCLALFAFAVAVYAYCRRRPPVTWPKRERTDSEQGLMSGSEKPQEENKEETQSDPLQKPEDKV